MRILKKSMYAFFVMKENGDYIVYSSFTGVVIRVFEEKYIKIVKKISETECIEYEDNDIFNIFLDKRILLDYDVNESLLVRGLYEEKVVRANTLDVMLIVTRRCNFRCVYCGQPHLEVNMNTENYQSILNFIKVQVLKHGYQNIRVTFFGGEPLLELNKICDFLVKLRDMLSDDLFSERKISYESGMSTNGYLLTPDIFEKLIRLNCNFYQISIDGMSCTHDRMRPLVSGRKTWKKIIDNLSYMISTKYNFNVTIRTNFNAEVAESLMEFYKYIGMNLKDERIGIYYETIKNQGNERTPEILSKFEELVFDIDIAQLIKDNDLVCTNSTTRLLPCSHVCYASRPNYFIFDENNQILKCSYALDSVDNVIGTLNTDGTLNFNEFTFYRWVYQDYLSEERCQQCKALPLCFGKRCPKSYIETGQMHCNIDMIQAEIAGLLDSYYR